MKILKWRLSTDNFNNNNRSILNRFLFFEANPAVRFNPRKSVGFSLPSGLKNLP
jgi:hypothetical protein